jgi:N-acetylneuraminic acid mutarotase
MHHLQRLDAKATFPGKARSWAVNFVIDNNAYVGAGTDNSPYAKDFYRYDPAANTWTKLPDLPTDPRFDASAFVVNGKAYVGMGYSGANDFWEFDSSNNKWSSVIGFPGNAIFRASAFGIGDKGYVTTGLSVASHVETYAFKPCNSNDSSPK